MCTNNTFPIQWPEPQAWTAAVVAKVQDWEPKDWWFKPDSLAQRSAIKEILPLFMASGCVYYSIHSFGKSSERVFFLPLDPART